MISLNNLYTKSSIGDSAIRRLFKHNITKQCWKIDIPNHQSLYLTCDHSIIVIRNGNKIQIKPQHILDSDFFILQNEQLVPVTQCTISNMGTYTDHPVYDIEVNEDCHDFFGNGILVHNSIYVRMDAILTKLFKDQSFDWNNVQQFSKVKEYVDNVFQVQLNSYCADFICDRFFTDQRRIEFKRQKISAQGEYLAKKHYIVHVYDNEGLPCNKWAYVGVQIKKNQLPDTIKELLKECVQGLIQFNWDNSKFQQKIRQMFDVFNDMSIDEISYIKNLGTLKRVQGFLTLQKGAGAHVRGAEFYNQIIKQLGIDHKYQQIRRFDRFRYVYIKGSNKYGINVIGYKDRWPKQFNQLFQIDRQKMFQKTVMAPFKKIIQNHNYGVFDPNQAMLLGQGNLSIFDL